MTKISLGKFLVKLIALMEQEFSSEELKKFLKEQAGDGKELKKAVLNFQEKHDDDAYKKARLQLSRGLRRPVLKALDQNKCQICNKPFDKFDIKYLTDPLDGGRDTLNNLMCVHRGCARRSLSYDKAELRKQIAQRRKTFLLQQANKLFASQAGREALKKFLNL